VSGKTNRNRSKNTPARRDNAPAHSSQRAAARGDHRSFEFAQQTYSGPLPAPADLQAYEMILPGTAERIITAFEQQTAHRHDLEQVVVAGSEGRSGRGQILTFIVLMTGVLGGCVVAVLGEPIAGGTIAGGALATGTVSYLVGGRPPKAE
jgi:uncharacterized membrane protein